VNRISIVLVVSLVLAASALAHEGHAHKIMGTVSAVRGSQVDVKSANGSTATVTLRSDTKIHADATSLKPADLKSGDRVVVTFVERKGPDGKTVSEASEIRVGTSGGSGATQ
jgi:hypothetical protein